MRRVEWAHRVATSGVLALLLLSLNLCAAADVVPDCSGDCGGTAAVGLNDILTGVNIVLGAGPLAQCPTLDTDANGEIHIDELVRAVTQPPMGCRLGPPDISGVWREEQLTLQSSNCNAATRGIILSALRSEPPMCDIHVTQNGASVHTLDCVGDTLDGTVDDSGTVRFSVRETDTADNGCTLLLSGEVAIDLSRSPTTAEYSVGLGFSGPCSPFSNCMAAVQSRWTKQ